MRRPSPVLLASLASAAMLATCGPEEPQDLPVCEVDGLTDPVPLEDNPPLPGDACPDASTLRAMAIQSGLQQGQDAAAAIVEELKDPGAVTVVMCGTGAPVPSERAQSCTAVFAGGRFLVFDVGDGAQRSMEDLGLPVADIDAVFLTHFHSDHMADLGEAVSRSWIMGRQTELPVYGGPAIERVVEGFNLVYTADELYRIAHHGEDNLPPDTLSALAVRIEDPGPEGEIVYDVDGLVVRAYRVDHAPVGPALGYRVEFGGVAVGISGDTVDTEGLRNLARGADVLVSEVLDPTFTLDMSCAFERIGNERNAELFRDIRTYHVGVEDVASVAAEAEVGQLVLTHMVPALPEAQAAQVFAGPIAETYDGPILLAADGDQVRLTID